MLMVTDLQRDMSIELIKRITEFSKGTCKVVILEEILKKQVYEELLPDLVNYFDYQVCVYYFDLPFTERSSDISYVLLQKSLEKHV